MPKSTKIIVITIILFFNLVDSTQLFCSTFPFHKRYLTLENLFCQNGKETHCHEKSSCNQDPFHQYVHSAQITNNINIFFNLDLAPSIFNLQFNALHYIEATQNTDCMVYGFLPSKIFITNSSLLI